jgi:hypothetical protein
MMVRSIFVSGLADAFGPRMLAIMSTNATSMTALSTACFRSHRLDWNRATLAGLVASSLLSILPVRADEFDPLMVYEEARVLNDQWQACAAAFVKERLQMRQTAERLAEQALDRCHARQGTLGSFLVKRVGGTSAKNVMALLREKYRSGLIAAVTELRTRD